MIIYDYICLKSCTVKQCRFSESHTPHDYFILIRVVYTPEKKFGLVVVRVIEKCLSHVLTVTGSAIDNQVDQAIYPNGSIQNPENIPPLSSQVESAARQPPLLKPQHETVYFRDGVRKIDFVLAFDSEKNHHTELRKTFENNLLLEGK